MQIVCDITSAFLIGVVLIGIARMIKAMSEGKKKKAIYYGVMNAGLAIAIAAFTWGIVLSFTRVHERIAAFVIFLSVWPSFIISDKIRKSMSKSEW